MMNIILHIIAHAHSYRKDNIYMQRGLVQSFTCIRALDIFCFVVFFSPGVACKAGGSRSGVCECVRGKFFQASDWSKIGMLHCRGGH